MNRDVAKYIQTINGRAPSVTMPSCADYAIIDLACDDRLVEQLYGAMSNQTITWWSLFAGTPWQHHWKNGPILVDLREADTYPHTLITQMSERSLGLLIQTQRLDQELLNHCCQWLSETLDGDNQLFRFYEPRALAPLLCVLDDATRHRLLGPDEYWYWHDTHQWRHAYADTPLPSNGAYNPSTIPMAQLESATPYRLAAEAQGLAIHYQTQLSGVAEPEHWVLERLFEAQEHGFTRSAHLERWLRLALQAGAGFHHRPPFYKDIKATGRSHADRLTAMENQQEASHA